MSGFFSELKRRNVFKVAIIYAATAWLIVQVIDTLFPMFEFPEWVARWVVIVLLAGFPVALILAWVFELTWEGVRTETDAGSRPADPQRKHASEVIVIVVLVLALGYFVVDKFVFRGGIDMDAWRGAPSIAVLPFANMSATTDNDYLADGLSEALLHMLAQVKGLKVTARTSSFAFKGRDTDVRDIAKQLGVATILEGSIQQQDQQVRITAQLIDATDGSHIWSKVFDRTLEDIFAVQDDIAGSVVRTLKASLLQEHGDDPGFAADIGTSRLEAYEAYLRAIASLGKGTPEDANQAVAQLETAVSFDPEFAVAWARLAQSYRLLSVLGTVPWQESVEPMRVAAERAIDLAPDLADAHRAMGAFHTAGKNLVLAEDELRQAVALNPNDAESLFMLSFVLSERLKTREALQMAQRAAEADPLDWKVQMNVAFRKSDAGLLDESIIDGREVLANFGTNMTMRHRYTDLLRRAGRWEEIYTFTSKMLEDDPDFLQAFFRMFYMHLYLADLEGADQWLRRIEQIAPVRAYDDRAILCQAMGDDACYIKYGQKVADSYLQVGSEDPFLYIWLGDIALVTGDNQSALKYHQITFDRRKQNGYRADLLKATNLALAFHRLGQLEERDRVLDELAQVAQEALENGARSAVIFESLAVQSAIRGDVAATVANLEMAADYGFSFVVGLETQQEYENVRGAPEFEAFITEMNADLARRRDAIFNDSP